MAFHALVFTKDTKLAEQFTAAFANLPLDWTLFTDERVPAQLLENESFDLLLVDCRSSVTTDLVRRARNSELNRDAFVFLLDDEKGSAAAAQLASDVILPAPLDLRNLVERVRDCMPQMVHERRRHARHPIDLPISLLKCEQIFPATAVNLSAGGMTVRVGCEVNHHEVMIVRFRLPGSEAEMHLYGKLAWRDAKSLVGIRFLAVAEEERAELTRWLEKQPTAAQAAG